MLTRPWALNSWQSAGRRSFAGQWVGRLLPLQVRKKEGAAKDWELMWEGEELLCLLKPKAPHLTLWVSRGRDRPRTPGFGRRWKAPSNWGICWSCDGGGYEATALLPQYWCRGREGVGWRGGWEARSYRSPWGQWWQLPHSSCPDCWSWGLGRWSAGPFHHSEELSRDGNINDKWNKIRGHVYMYFLWGRDCHTIALTHAGKCCLY